MARRSRIVPWLVLALAPGLAGCHVTRGKAPEAGKVAAGLAAPGQVAPGPAGPARAEQAFAAPLRPTLTAALGALDDARVRPEKLVIHGASDDAGKQPALAIEPAEANLAMLPDGTRADDIFVQHQLRLPGTPPTAFTPIYVTYQGKAADGRSVTLTIATKRGDEANNRVAVKLGHRADPAWSGGLLDRVAARLGPGAAIKAPAEPPALP